MLNSQVSGEEYQVYFCNAGAKAKDRKSQRAEPGTSCATLGTLLKLCVSQYSHGSNKNYVILGLQRHGEDKGALQGSVCYTNVKLAMTMPAILCSMNVIQEEEAGCRG